MKKTVALLVGVVLIAFALFHHTGQYSGVYDYNQNPNVSLKINNNRTYELYNAVGKTSQFIKGKYTVNNNKITLVPDEGNIDKDFTGTLMGKVEGSTIVITSLKGEFVKE